jgi:hypothetical protein
MGAGACSGWRMPWESCALTSPRTVDDVATARLTAPVAVHAKLVAGSLELLRFHPQLLLSPHGSSFLPTVTAVLES